VITAGPRWPDEVHAAAEGVKAPGGRTGVPRKVALADASWLDSMGTPGGPTASGGATTGRADQAGRVRVRFLPLVAS
ncbi:MAG: hypothetical protein ACREJI_10500, partial [Candidatus Methylomirabilales bacterium]